MTREQKKHDINAIRTLIAFAYGDTRHGGPSHTEELADLKRQLKELEAQPTED